MSGDRVHPNSAGLVAAMLPDRGLQLDLGTTEEYYGIPYAVVPGAQPLVPIEYGTDGIDYSDESHPGPFELYNAERMASGFRVISSAIWNLKVNHTRPPGWTSADAGGLPIFPGLLKYEEVAADRLHHALRFTVPQVRRAYVAPRAIAVPRTTRAFRRTAPACGSRRASPWRRIRATRW